MTKGFDTTADASTQANALVQLGYGFLGRYLSQSTWKILSQAEAAALGAAGLRIVLVYEDGPTNASYFAPGRGTLDAERAMLQAQHVGAKAGVAIYFTVDYDASKADIAGPVTAYFKELATALGNGQQGSPRYQVGVYGSGNTCNAMLGSGSAKYAWLAQSRGWGGYSADGPWNIVQGSPSIASILHGDADESLIADIGAM